ncbi:MAG TPA: hypothetical protein VNH11_24735 [Pirellulales bacterium]|nr:hypothetical protein [Pirellulales bacterium]
MASLSSIVQGIDGLPTTWHVPPELLRFRGIRREPLFCYLLLWQVVGCRPGRLTVDYLRLQFTLAASERAVRRWLTSLEEAGLIDVLSRGPRQADLRIRNWRQPRAASEAAAASEAQLPLPFAETGPMDPGPSTIPIWDAPQRPERRPNHDRPTAG